MTPEAISPESVSKEHGGHDRKETGRVEAGQRHDVEEEAALEDRRLVRRHVPEDEMKSHAEQREERRAGNQGREQDFPSRGLVDRQMRDRQHAAQSHPGL